MKNFLTYFIMAVGLVFVYFNIIFPIRNYLCEQVGMRASLIVNSCVIKEQSND